MTVDHLSRYFEKVAALSLEQPPSPPPRRGLLPSGSGDVTPDDFWEEMVGAFRSMALLLGQRTAEMHRAVAANRSNLAFAPEPLGKLYQRSMYQSMRNLTGRLCDRLAGALMSFRKVLDRWPRRSCASGTPSSLAFGHSSIRP